MDELTAAEVILKGERVRCEECSSTGVVRSPNRQEFEMCKSCVGLGGDYTAEYSTACAVLGMEPPKVRPLNHKKVMRRAEDLLSSQEMLTFVPNVAAEQVAEAVTRAFPDSGTKVEVTGSRIDPQDPTKLILDLDLTLPVAVTSVVLNKVLDD